MRKPILSFFLILGFLFLSPLMNIGEYPISNTTINIDNSNSPDIEHGVKWDSVFNPSSGPTRTGILPAIEFLQYGTNTHSTGSISIRTDEQKSVITDLTLDTANGWKSNQVELNISELRKLFALNGTFSDGYPGVNIEPSGGVSYYPLGWDANSFNHDLGKQILSTAYSDTDTKFIELEVEGQPDGGPDYKVFKDSYAYWYQEITHSPSETDFLLSFDLLYDSGPIGPKHLNDFQLRIEADWGGGNTILWSLDPVTIPARDLWVHIGSLPVSLTGVPTTFDLRFVFEILESRTLKGDDPDFDDDWDNARYVRFHVDDISLTSAYYMDPDDVNMRVGIPPIGETTVSGANGIGQALVNHSNWDTSPLPIEILADSPVSFEYEARFVHVFKTGNSSWTNSASESGVSYSVDIDTSPTLTSYFYVANHDDLEDFSLEIPHASDYGNATILDATPTDVTSFCTLSQGMILINGALLDSLGWWKVTLDAPNYARMFRTQQYQMPSWENQTQFNSGDLIRALAMIGTSASTPTTLENVSLEWVLPNNTQWSYATVNDGVDGTVISPVLNLGPYNATPGEWSARVFWKNGTEIAYSETYFNLFHSSNCLPVEASIEAETDSTVTCAVRLRDADTNEYLLDDLSTVVGNWSGETITFQRNLAKSWWEGDLNTSLVGRGNFTILINATRPYYSSSSCIVLIEVTSPAVFSHLGQDYVDVNPGSNYNALFRYSYTDDTGIEDALIEVVSITGPVGGLSYGGTIAVPGQPGNYSIEFQVDIGGSYSIIVRASKVDHNTETVSFNIVASGIGTDFFLLNGSSDVVNVASNYQLAVHYRNSTGEGLSGAVIEVVNVVPASGLAFAPLQFHGNGTYSILISAQNVGVYSITLRASLTGYDSQLTVFTLVVSPLSSSLSVDPVVYSISVDSNYTLFVTFSNLTHHGLENASISVISVDPPSGLWISGTTDLGSGLYSITLIPSAEGTYNLVLTGALENYQNSTTLFTLVVTEVSTNLGTSDGQVSGFTNFTDTFEVLLVYERTDSHAIVSGATIEISSVVGLEYDVVETPQGYLLTINPNVLGRWSLSIHASKPHYRNASMIFDFEVRATVTSLTGNGLASSLYFGVLYNFILSYDYNNSIGIANATISPTYSGVQGNPFLWIDHNNGTYSFTMTAGKPGSYIVSIAFSKYGYASAESIYSFEILAVPLDVTTSPLPDSFYGSRVYSLDIYVSSSQHGALEDAEVAYSNSLNPFILSESFGNGWYNITFSPETGNFSAAVIQINKDGFEEVEIEFSLFVSSIPFRIPAEYMLNNTYSLLQGTNLDLVLHLIADDTEEQLSDALVSFSILGTGISGTFENHTDGSYIAAIPVPSEASTYSLRILIQKNQFRDMVIDIVLISVVDSEALVRGYMFTSLQVAALLLGVGSVVYAGRRRQNRISRQRRVELLGFRERFNDASNIIGFLIIQRTNGLPIYSKIIKGGFEMSIISGFISAISNFSEELRTEEKLWTAIPISEVVTAVHTEALICSLLTVDAPSRTLIENLEEVAIQLGSKFDSNPDLLSAISRSSETALGYKDEFDHLFETHFDFKILISYMSYDAAQKGKFPQIAEIFDSTDVSPPFTTSELVALLLASGLEERRAYAIVIEAIEAGFLSSVKDRTSSD